MPIRRQLSTWQMFNINFGYIGIQFAWALQFANISGIFKFLGANDDQIPILWLAGPITGLIIPPIVGYISDHTWVRYLGKRRVYIALGSFFAIIALFAIPNTRDLTHALLLVWLLDSGLNMAMHPYRALIADKTPLNQQTKCFSILTMASCLGSATAFIMPWVLAFFFNDDSYMDSHSIPESIEIAFTIGALTLLFTTFWTVISTTESKLAKHTKLDLTEKRDLKKYLYIPTVMRDLIKVEFFTWIGLFSFIIYYALGIAQNIFHLPEGADISTNQEFAKLLQQGVELCGLYSFVYILVSTCFVGLLSKLTYYAYRKNIYASCLLLGGLGMVITSYSFDKTQLLAGVVLIGLAWGAAMTLPFAILSSGVPNDKVGWYMGYYNLFVVIPQIIVSCSFGYIINMFFNHHAMSVILLGGCSMLIASLFALRIKDPYHESISKDPDTSNVIAPKPVKEF